VKYRAPFSFAEALFRIGDRLGWVEVARIANRTVRCVRDWSEPDTRRTPPIATALALDRAWAEAGGTGAPLRDALDHQLGQACMRMDYDPARLADATAVCFREGAEAGEALLYAVLPNATAAQRREAAREVCEGIAAYAAALPLLGLAHPPAPP
jgi:hypothetical protein